MTNKIRGVGLQVNPHIQRFENQLDPTLYDFVELLCDEYAAPLDSGLVIDPPMRQLLERYQSQHPTLAHGNYGNEFGFEPLDETPGVLRHIEIAKAMNSPWYADHMFYGFQSHSNMWSSPIPFSRAELDRIAGRAAAFQDRLQMPLLHENAFYYEPFPGSDMPEGEFLAEITHRAGTYHLIDLHNTYSNSRNFNDYDAWEFLRTIPMDRVIEVHLAGGVEVDGWYHDFHCAPVPEPVWDMLDYVLERATKLEGIVLEVQGRVHSARSPDVDDTWSEMIASDLRRARTVWQKAANRAGGQPG